MSDKELTWQGKPLEEFVPTMYFPPDPIFEEHEAEMAALTERLAAAEQRAERAEAALATLLAHLPSDEVLSESWQGDMYWEDIFALAEIVPIYRAALAAPATQPDERAAAEQAIIAAGRVIRLHCEAVPSCNPSGLDDLKRALDALDATDGAAKEGA